MLYLRKWKYINFINIFNIIGADMVQKVNNEVTSKKAASAASRVLSNPKSSKDAKSAAASALTQRPGRGKK